MTSDRMMEKIEPMRPVTGTDPIAALEGTHTFDAKMDGIRCLVYVDEGAVRLISRQGVDLTSSFPEVVSANPMFDGAFVLDAELVAGSGSLHHVVGRSMIARPSAVSQAAKRTPCVLTVFDLLVSKGEDIRRFSYLDRRHLLDHLVQRWDNQKWKTTVVSPSSNLLDLASQFGMEGVVAKRNTAPYVGGNSRHWLKYKVRPTAFCVVLSRWRSPTGRLGLNVGLRGNDGEVDLVGSVERGISSSTWSAIDVAMKQGYTIVVEVSYLTATVNNHIHHVTLRAVRPDISEEEARVDQLIQRRGIG